MVLNVDVGCLFSLSKNLETLLSKIEKGDVKTWFLINHILTGFIDDVSISFEVNGVFARSLNVLVGIKYC